MKARKAQRSILTADIGRIGDLGKAHGGFMSVAAVTSQQADYGTAT